MKTKQLTKFKFDLDKLKEESEVLITTPVKITHPTDLILLPLVDNQLWHLRGAGGSGTYKWSTLDPTIAEPSQQAQLKPFSVGQTTLILRDALNPKNSDMIKVEVAKVARMVWLES